MSKVETWSSFQFLRWTDVNFDKILSKNDAYVFSFQSWLLEASAVDILVNKTSARSTLCSKYIEEHEV